MGKEKIVFRKYEVVIIDESWGGAVIVYDCNNKSIALKTIKDRYGEDEAEECKDNLVKKRVIKYKQDDGYWYMWGDKCEYCGRKNNGKVSYVAEF